MTKRDCIKIREELEEANLDEACSPAAILHLQECVDCKDFHQSRTRLRRLVGSLETVGAPADFDFRLRARLAAGGNGSAYFFGLADSALRPRTLAVAALVFLIGAVVVLNQWRRPHQPAVATVSEKPVEKNTTAEAKEGTQPQHQPVLSYEGKGIQSTLAVADPRLRPINKVRSALVGFESSGRRRPTLATREFSSLGAPVVRRDETLAATGESAAFPIDAPYQSLKVSLDDGSGGSRTISLPPVSFGSQRVLESGNVSNRLSAKGIW